jgi:hypothetical protein
MFKLFVVTKRNPKLTMEQFIDHYEHVHAPMNRRLYPQMKRYVRNYLKPVDADMPTDNEAPFDCITEAYFDDEEGFRSVLRDMENNEENTAEHLEDEEKLFDRSRVWWFTAETRES